MTQRQYLSYGGELSELRALPDYAALRQAYETHTVEVLESVMSLTGMVNFGKDAITLGSADVPHTFA